MHHEKNHSTDRAELRNTLLSNGYRPLPLLDKGIRIKGWSRAEINQEWLDKYRRSGAYANTGIRCDDLITFDIDVLSEPFADEIEAFIEQEFGATELCRVGRWPKRLLVYRKIEGAEDPSKSARTGRYEGDHMVELLCGHGRQFAAYGIHPGTGEPYYWEGEDLLSVPYADVPQIELDAAYGVLEACDLILQGHGLTLVTPGVRSGFAGMNEYDLADDDECLIDGKTITWGDLKGELDKRGQFGNIRRDHGEFGDSSAVHFMLAKGSGEPCAHDFVMDCTHWEAPPSDLLAELLPEQPDDSIFIPEDMQDLIKNCVILSDLTVRRVDDPVRVYPLAGFVRALKHLRAPHPNPPKANPNQTIAFTDVWERSPETLRANYAAMRPDYPEDDILKLGSASVLNTYLPPDLPSEGGELRTFDDFMTHLVPKPDERDLFLDWWALKTLNPGYRMHAVLMVTPVYGTGRGTIAQIMELQFGDSYVQSVQLSDLIGGGSQAQYNEFLATSLMICVDETLEEKEDQQKWTARHLAYERLKIVCDPVARRMHVKRKYGRNSHEHVFASMYLNTNHVDALAIEPGDRRLIVLDNCETPLIEAPADLYSRIHEWHADKRNIGALDRMLLERAERVTYDPFGMPPMTPAKERMIEAGQSDLDRVFEYMQETMPGDLVTPAQWRQFAHSARLALDADLPIGDKLDAALSAVIAKRGRRLEALGSGGQIKVAGRPVRPWIIRNFGQWKGNEDRDAMRAEILKNGDPGGAVIPFNAKT